MGPQIARQREDAKSHCLHYFFPLCIFKCFFKSPVWDDASLHLLHLFDFFQCVFLNESLNCLHEKRQSPDGRCCTMHSPIGGLVRFPDSLYGSFTGSWITEREGELVGLTSPFFLAALYLGCYVSDHLEIWTQILTFEAWDPHDSASPDSDNLGE